MPQPYGKALTNESICPNIVELAVGADGLEVELAHRIIDFHKSRHIEPRHGRRIKRENQTYYRWCFSDLATARAFLEQFGGSLVLAKKQ
jgi:chitinase